MSKIAFVYRGDSPHPAHRGFAEEIDADIHDLDHSTVQRTGLSHSIVGEVVSGFLLTDYDIYLVEGTRALYGALAKRLVHDSTVIYLAGDQALYKLLDRSYEHESNLNSLISKYGMNILKYIFNQYIDGFIAVSKFSQQYTNEILSKKPSYVANPYIQSELYDIWRGERGLRVPDDLRGYDSNRRLCHDDGL